MTNETVKKVDDLVDLCYGISKAAGWWNNDRNDGECIALMHSELSEALEALRKDLNDDHLPEFKGVTVELADTLIRIFDYAGGRGLNLGEALQAKLEYNKQRADHKLENRAKEGGKRF